ncbi:hypothetical protein Scep_029916 [Stephania cephalantha]|uniref:START domain-containing protein n=1 Tax=Stephania cephalantha TaxID=152367 RepID=A0AAP0HI33_9MAGN
MDEIYMHFTDFWKRPVVIETLVDILLCAVPIWVAVMIGMVIGWSWRPRFTGLVFLGLRSKFRFLWTAPPGFGARRLWFAFTALSAFSVGRTVWSNFKGKGEDSAGSGAAAAGSASPQDLGQVGERSSVVQQILCSQCSVTQPLPFGSESFGGTLALMLAVILNTCNNCLEISNDALRTSTRADFKYSPTISNNTRIHNLGCGTSNVEVEHDPITKKDLEHLLHLAEGKGGDITWQFMMERSTPNFAYEAWRHESETGPTILRSRTVYEDANPELVRDFFWDDEFRVKWDSMLSYAKTLEECPHTGTMIVHWIKKFPFFCSDREYIFGRRIWESEKTYYCVTKSVPYPGIPKRDKPRRVELYFSSWTIKPVESRRGNGHSSACEVTLVHYEDMGIPKDIANLGVRHGMWGTVKKFHAGLRAYQLERKSEAPLSRSALMARITTKVAVNGNTDSSERPLRDLEKNQTLDLPPKVEHCVDWRWIVLGGTVAVVGLHTGVIGKSLLFGVGAARRLARK